MNNYIVVIPAAGFSTRFNDNKILYKIYDIEIIKRTASIFLNDIDCCKIILAVNENDYSEILSIFSNSKIDIILGMETRFQTVKKAIFHLVNLSLSSNNILIHDGARPFLNNKLLSKIKKSIICDNYDATVPYIDIYDSCINFEINQYINRESIKLIQTPQAFKLNILLDAYKLTNDEFNDEYSMILSSYNKQLKTNFIKGNRSNIKVTTKDDLDFLEWIK